MTMHKTVIPLASTQAYRQRLHPATRCCAACILSTAHEQNLPAATVVNRQSYDWYTIVLVTAPRQLHRSRMIARLGRTTSPPVLLLVGGVCRQVQLFLSQTRSATSAQPIIATAKTETSRNTAASFVGALPAQKTHKTGEAENLVKFLSFIICTRATELLTWYGLS